MKTGRKRIPDAIKIAAGTFRADRAVAGVPTDSLLLAEHPSPPTSLGEVGRKKWAEVVEKFDQLKLLESRFLDGIEMYCRAWDRLEKHEATLKAEGCTVRSPKTGFPVQHPEVSMAKEARSEILRYQIEFGFTASSASSVKTATPAKRGVPNRAKDVG